MNVDELIRELRFEQKRGNGKLEVRQFSLDHDPEKHDEGTGTTATVNEYKNDKGEIFVGLQT